MGVKNDRIKINKIMVKIEPASKLGSKPPSIPILDDIGSPPPPQSGSKKGGRALSGCVITRGVAIMALFVIRYAVSQI